MSFRKKRSRIKRFKGSDSESEDDQVESKHVSPKKNNDDDGDKFTRKTIRKVVVDTCSEVSIKFT